MILAEISPGELIDRITILEIKAERIKDPAKLTNVQYALASLRATRRRVFNMNPEVMRLAGLLKDQNEILWEIEDDLRSFETDPWKSFDWKFIGQARVSRQQNDLRAAIKKEIDGQFQTVLMTEEKSFQ